MLVAEALLRETDPDVQLMLAFRAGDEAAFEALFRRWAGPLLRYLERMVRDSATAEELVQEAFLRVHKARDRYQPEARFSTWLYRIATNLALNELRRPRRSHRHASVDDDGAALQLVTSEPPADEIAHARLVGAHVADALEVLPERQRMALWLAAVEGQSYAEVAETLSTSEKSVKALVHRARVHIIARLEARGVEGRSDSPARPDAGSGRWHD